MTSSKFFRNLPLGMLSKKYSAHGTLMKMWMNSDDFQALQCQSVVIQRLKVFYFEFIRHKHPDGTAL